MTRRLPNLNQLRAFEAAARHLSFGKAADELHVTHAAVSHQIKALESDLGLQLFHRRARSVELTEAAKEFAARMTVALDAMAEATRALRSDRMTGTLRVSVPPYSSDRLLMPRLARFHAGHPGLTVIPVADAAQIDLRRDAFDAAIRYGDGTWEGLDAMPLHKARLVPVASPALVEGSALPLSPDAIARLPLGCIAGQEAEWTEWFAAAGLDGAAPEVMAAPPGTRAIDIAFSGQRVALISTLVAAEDVASGELVRLSDVALETPRAMHVVWPATEFPDPRVLEFAAWLKGELEALG